MSACGQQERPRVRTVFAKALLEPVQPDFECRSAGSRERGHGMSGSTYHDSDIDESEVRDDGEEVKHQLFAGL